MTKKYLIKLGAPILAIALMAACGTGNDQNQDQDPVEDEVPMDEEAPLEDPAEEIQEEAPFNEDDGETFDEDEIGDAPLDDDDEGIGNDNQ